LKFTLVFKMSQQLSIYIPRVFLNITKETIVKVFHERKLGEVEHIDLIIKKGLNEQYYNACYIHFTKWYETPESKLFQESVKVAETKLIYNEPWYWLCLENKASKYNTFQPKLKINVDGFKLKNEEIPEEVTKKPLQDVSVSQDFSKKVLKEVSKKVFEEVSKKVLEEVSKKALELEDVFQDDDYDIDTEFEKFMEEVMQMNDFECDEVYDTTYSLVDENYSKMLEDQLIYLQNQNNYLQIQNNILLNMLTTERQRK